MNFCVFCQNEGVTIYSFDALFGLPRKNRPPLHGHLTFIDQSKVDEYVANNSSDNKGRQQVSFDVVLFILSPCLYHLHQECHNFLAGNMLRSLWMKQLCLDLHVVTSFLQFFLI